MRLVETQVLEIELHEGGPPGGPPILLLHGWPDAPRGWSPVATRLHASGWRTIVPALRGCGETRFRIPDAVRDGRGVALAADAVDLLDVLGHDRVPVVGHDWGARAAYTLAGVAPERVSAIAAVALGYQPRGKFTMPRFEQARAFWYQWLMYVDAGVQAVASDPIAFARIQWESWSPPGWFDEDEFRATARSFLNEDWLPITLQAYRSRFLATEPCDPRYEPLAQRLAQVERVDVPTLMIQGGADRCDEPASSENQEGFFTAGYPRLVFDGIGHFPHREAPDELALAVDRHLRTMA
jgi:pimeloyl-ACP methyl ester carboxylesterase